MPVNGRCDKLKVFRKRINDLLSLRGPLTTGWLDLAKEKGTPTRAGI